jgi:hypothetical protein
MHRKIHSLPIYLEKGVSFDSDKPRVVNPDEKAPLTNALNRHLPLGELRAHYLGHLSPRRYFSPLTVFAPRSIAILPVRTISFTPYWFRRLSRASIFSVSPVTCRITVLAPTSTI